MYVGLNLQCLIKGVAGTPPEPHPHTNGPLRTAPQARGEWLLRPRPTSWGRSYFQSIRTVEASQYWPPGKRPRFAGITRTVMR